MGLAEKKVIKSLEEEVIPALRSRINAAIGKDIEISINWDSFETEAQLREVQHQCLDRIAEGLEKIAKDDMGKEALNESLNTLVVNNITDASAKKIELSDGTLTVDGKWEDFGSGIFRPVEYSRQIEGSL
ncbi:hypothetical protein MNBD_GAMMA16-61 [hydrothermal vent metagenome]|uniref:Uncharacterized protein n=1 Tax=hydrothermal vent metagenome TaxID=652676 RepID=A0A3B0ZU64_9ZZZZ